MVENVNEVKIVKISNMGFEGIGMLIAGISVTGLVFYLIKFIIEALQGKYRG